MRTPLKFGLDWTPNTAHSCLFAAADEIRRLTGRDVEFVCPGEMGAPATPAHGLISGSLDLGLVPCDQLVTLELETPGLVQAFMNLHSRDISALCVMSTSSIQRPADLAGLRYASCGYPLEASTIRAIIRKDLASSRSRVSQETPPEEKGDKSDQEILKEACPPLRIKTEEMLLTAQAECAWMYRPWEVLRAKRAGIELRCFPIQDYVSFGEWMSMSPLDLYQGI